MFGYLPSKECAATTSQGLPMLKILMNGDVSWFAFKLSSFVKARVDLGLDPISVDTMNKHILTMDADLLQKIIEKGCEVVAGVLKSGLAVYIPTGWVCVERSSTAVLIYGIRKTIALNYKGAAVEYQAVIDLQLASKRSALKFEEMMAALVVV